MFDVYVEFVMVAPIFEKRFKIRNSEVLFMLWMIYILSIFCWKKNAMKIMHKIVLRNHFWEACAE